MITLGINAAFHDSAAALVVDGITVAAAEEERFTRVKHAKRPVPFSAWELPFHAIDFCLGQAGVALRDVDHVAYSFDPRHFLGERVDPQADTITLPLEPAAHTGHGWENPWDPLFAAYVLNAPGQLVDGAPHHLKKRLAGARYSAKPGGTFQWHFVNHHICHQASAFLAAPYDSCAVMTLDGRGEHATTSYGVFRDQRYRSLGEVRMPHSLGMLYERVTTHLGFLHSSDEYKVMALAALGTPVYREVLADAVRVGRGGSFTVADMNMAALFGAPREPGTPMLERHLDLAASLQDVLEATVLEITTWLREVSGEQRLAMAGGVALNCVMNARLRDEGPFESIWVQPAAGDAGTALGAALWVDGQQRLSSAEQPARHVPALLTAVTPGHPVHSNAPSHEATPLAPRRWQMEHVYLGPGFSDDEIERQLKWAQLPYRRMDDLAGETAALLADNLIIGWFQGRMEFGPRSLGARSIIASPIDPAMQSRLNELKDREDFRPVAPAVLEEEFARWFTPAEANGGASPFMLFVYDVLPGQGERIPSACHTDRTARVQTVGHDTHPRFHALLKAFQQRTGVPVLVNTSFNVRGEPIVCTPKAAIEAFYSTPLDALVMGSFVLEKPRAARTP